MVADDILLLTHTTNRCAFVPVFTAFDSNNKLLRKPRLTLSADVLKFNLVLGVKTGLIRAYSTVFCSGRA